MKNLQRFTVSFAIAVSFSFMGCEHQKKNYLMDNFINPPEDTKPGLYWYWINEHVSKEGITKDLEAMKEVGIGEAFIGNIYDGGEPGNIKTMSKEWKDCMQHAIKEGRRLGIAISLFNSPGWSQSGGPWVETTESMRFLTYSDTIINTINDIVNINLKKPTKDFQDVAVLAYELSSEENPIIININSDKKIINKSALFDGDKTTKAIFNNSHRSSVCIDLVYDKEFIPRSLLIQPTGIAFNTTCNISVKKENQYIPIGKMFFDRSNTSLQLGPLPDGKLIMGVEEIKGKEFRITMDDLPENFELSQISVSTEIKLEKVTEKTLSKLPNTSSPSWSAYRWEHQKYSKDYDFINADNVINISEYCKDGNLEWNAPKGNWKIVRIGMSPTYTTNTPAAPDAKGLEIDKLNKNISKKHFDSFVGEIRKGLTIDELKALKRVVADSYEVGPQNWSDTFRNDFIEYMGYDPIPYLPVITGDIIGSVEESDRFLWDIRRMVADLIAKNYVGGLKEVAEENNMSLWLENYGHWGYPAEFLKYSKHANDIGGEFWAGSEPGAECKMASSACNIYGKNDVYAESYTAWGQSYRWHPKTLRAKGDWSYTEGINNVILHVYIHQPYEEKQPGINAWFGIEFNRHNTWFEQSKSWIDYQRRCCFMLKQGIPERDLCFFIGDDAPQMNYWVDPNLPDGYSYDFINSDVIINYLDVKDGKLVLPSGITYSALVLPPLKTMRPELLSAINNLLNKGAIVVGDKPLISPSLKNYPDCDYFIKDLSAKMWGTENELSRNIGKGKLFRNVNLDNIINTIELSKDIEIKNNNNIKWIHRKDNDKHIYFLTNQSENDFNDIIKFRVNNMQPEIWNAVTGEIRKLNSFRFTDSKTEIPVKLKGGESIFIVFADKINTSNDDLSFELNYPVQIKILDLKDTWNIKFENNHLNQRFDITAGSLTDWSKSEDNRVKYFSGSAVYRTFFNYNGKNSNVNIHFDSIDVIGTVFINDKEVGTLWTPPYELNITDYIKQGNNKLEVKVSNLWVNQLIYQKFISKQKNGIWNLVEPLDLNTDPVASGISGDCYLYEL